jgi:hypothetical protein
MKENLEICEWKQKILVLSTTLQNILDSLDTLTMIVEATQMTEKEPQGTHFILEQV